MLPVQKHWRRHSSVVADHWSMPRSGKKSHSRSISQKNKAGDRQARKELTSPPSAPRPSQTETTVAPLKNSPLQSKLGESDSRKDVLARSSQRAPKRQNGGLRRERWRHMNLAFLPSRDVGMNTRAGRPPADQAPPGP